MSLSEFLQLIESLSTTQEHFLKKFLLEEQLKNELHYLSKPQCLGYLGPPFSSPASDEVKLPLLRFFYSEFIRTFPLITSNPEPDQIGFWRDTVQPFVESFNSKHVSEGVERKTEVTKRHQVNRKLLSGLLLFFNSMIISPRDQMYFSSEHLKLSDQGKLHKISKGPLKGTISLQDYQRLRSLDDFLQMAFVNDVHLNVIAVLPHSEVVPEGPLLRKSWGLSALQMFSLARTKAERLHYRFIIHVVTRKEVNGSFEYESHFTSKLYHDFRQLEHMLKKQFPFLMKNEISPLPKKFKHDNGVKIAAADVTSSTSSIPSQESSNETKFHREKLRLALRGYLNTLGGKPEIAHCEVFKGFLDNSDNFTKLSVEERKDYEQRLDLERQRLETQQQFQQNTAKVIHKLSKDFDRFKTKMVVEPNLISNLFKELEYCDQREAVSPVLRSFVDWSKLEVAATLYQVFLTQDNSNEWLSKCRKFHRLFPYSVCYGILKYTNPVNIVTRLMDLLLMDMPSFSLKGEKKRSNSLLSMAFIMLLDEDLEGYDKERAKLLDSSPLNDPNFKFVINRINNYVYQLDEDSKEEIKEESKMKGKNLLLHILNSPKVSPAIKQENLAHLDTLERSYAAYQKLEEHKKVSDTEVYVNIRQLWQLETRTKDKNVMKKMWQEPELTRLIKKILSLFFNPMMSVMKKCDIHLVFRDWQAFMNDLMEELTTLDEGEMYFSSPVEMFGRFKTLLDKHEHSLWRFMHNLYRKDDDKIFLGIIGWIEHFLEVLRMKNRAPTTVTLNLGALTPESPIDNKKFVEQLDGKMILILRKRQLLKEILAASANKEKTNTDVSADKRQHLPENNTIEFTTSVVHLRAGAETHSPRSDQISHGMLLFSNQGAIDNEWKRLNENVVNMNTADIGLSIEDVEEFNLFSEHDKRADTGYTDACNPNDATELKMVAVLEIEVQQFSLEEMFKIQGAVHDALCTMLLPAHQHGSAA